MDAYVGEIRILAGNVIPNGWVLCDGRRLNIFSARDLFQVINYTYGGEEGKTFELPNLSGRAPIHHGKGDGLTDRPIGEKWGSSSVTLTESQLPQHTHAIKGSSATGGGTANPANAVWGSKTPIGQKVYGKGSPVPMSPHALSATGGSQPHNNRQPYLGLNFIICMDGIMPPHS